MKTVEAIETRLISVGNSRGVRIAKILLEQSGLEGELKLIAEPGRIVIEKLSIHAKAGRKLPNNELPPKRAIQTCPGTRKPGNNWAARGAPA